MVKVAWEVAAGNEIIKKGALGSTIRSILDELKPEAVYFSAEGGKRGCTLIVNLDDASQIPAVAEPFFLTGNAAIEFIPVMLPEDLAKAEEAIGKAVEKYG
jgi:hypothetical protein